MNAAIGAALDRVDGPEKVTGQARYAAEFRLERLAHAALVPSPAPSGRIVSIDTAAAEASDGVIDVLTHLNAPALPYLDREEQVSVDPDAGEQLHVLQGPEILFAGQPVALVVAETLPQARFAARLVKVAVEREEARTDFEEAEPSWIGDRPQGAEGGRGDAARALNEAEVSITSTSRLAREQHHPIEPHATMARWQDGILTLYDKTQWVHNVRQEIAHVFGLDADAVRVVSPFVGGAFGSALRTWPHVTLAALAARETGRPVRLELDRHEMTWSTGFRPACRQTVRLGARRDGRLTAICHDVVSQTSVYEDYGEAIVAPYETTYACPNVRTRKRVVRLNTNTPCPMRAPGLVTGVHGLEVAMDELAWALRMDPLELRRINHAERDEAKDLPWSSKQLLACYAAGAERFGWSRRSPEPGSLRDGTERIGLGMATSIYPAHRAEASVQATLLANGTALVRTASSDMGPGTYTSMTQVASDVLGLDPGAIRFEIGDSTFPDAPVHGGSITMASVGSAVRAAAQAVAGRLARLACAAAEGAFAGRDSSDVVIADGALSTRDGGIRRTFAEVLGELRLARVEALGTATPGDVASSWSSSAFGAVFAEVRVDADIGRIRVSRLVGAYDVGRVINPKIARSQCLGGLVGGLGMALMEQVEWDERLGRPMNASLAEYLVPVNADVGDLDVSFVPSEDRVLDPLGAKGVAEVAICGVSPAIANAVWHATGRRLRDLPMTPERLLASG